MDKLEKHIKEKLEERKITPSAQAWDKISAQLAAEAPKTSGTPYWWWGVAASILVIIGLFVVINANRTAVNAPIKNVPIVVQTKQIPKEQLQEKSIIKTVEKTAVVVVKTNAKQSATIKEKKELPLPVEAVPELTVVDQLAATDKTKPIQLKEDPLDLAIANKIEAVLAQVNQMEGMAQTVTDAEIEAMLLAAQKEILADKIVKASGRVDAMALLDQVELELYDDQRNPLFIKLKEGFFKLRTAVASRNQ